jgi:biopolymer transport protein ExbD
MSHGPAAQGSVAEPNLTPLLDLVLQLLMFFMMTVNFVTEQANEDIKLPDSQSAKPMDKSQADVLFVNLKPYRAADFEGRYPSAEVAHYDDKFKDDPFCAMVLGKPPMKLSELQPFLKQQYEDAVRNAKDGKIHTVIVIRAHKDSQYDKVYRVLQMCKNVGYHDLHLRVISKGGGPRS